MRFLLDRDQPESSVSYNVQSCSEVGLNLFILMSLHYGYKGQPETDAVSSRYYDAG